MTWRVCFKYTSNDTIQYYKTYENSDSAQEDIDFLTINCFWHNTDGYRYYGIADIYKEEYFIDIDSILR